MAADDPQQPFGFMLTKYLAIVLFTFALSCSAIGEQSQLPPTPTCWDNMVLPATDLRILHMDGEGHSEAAEELRATLIAMLDAPDFDCPDYVEYYHVAISGLTKQSLVDIAIVADYPDFILANSELVYDGIRRGDELEFGGQFVQAAAAFEAFASLQALVDIGVDVTANSPDGFTPIFAAEARRTDGLRIIALLAQAGVDLESQIEDDITALLASYVTQDLDKALCLRSLGAAEPPYVEYFRLAQMSEGGPYFSDAEFQIESEDLIHTKAEIELICRK